MINSDEELIRVTEKLIHQAQISSDDSIVDMGYIIGILAQKSGIMSTKIRDDISIISYQKEDYNRSFDNCSESLRDISWSEDECKRLRFNQHFSIDKVSDRYKSYDPDNISKMLCILLKNRKKPNYDKQVTVTMTSCKRYDLFYDTVCSFINCCIDIDRIDEWIVVDDNSSNEDRMKMMTDFPFIKYIWKNNENKGHIKSMNIIREMVTTPYVFHIEDDWLFFRREKYINDCINIVNEDEHYGQCLLNRSYAERATCHDMVGGIRKFSSENIRYYEHEFYTGDKFESFKLKNNGKKHCAYWPHYSLRVGLMKTDVWKEIGLYDETSNHFEMEYAYRYTNKGYKTVYLDNIYCLHIGRCTFERGNGKLNAYDLNKVSQFGEPIKEKVDDTTKRKEEKVENKEEVINVRNGSEKYTLLLSEQEKTIHPLYQDSGVIEYNSSYRMKTYVLNMKKRQDRLKQFVLNNHDEIEKLQYHFFEAIDGETVEPKPKTLKLFETGDYHYRKGIIGCASSHIKMWHELIISPDLDIMLILEDDVTLSRNFTDKLVTTLRRLPPENWDILFLGHFLYPQYREEGDNEDVIPITEKWSKERCMNESMGGTIGYVIHKRGAVKMFKHIHEHGIYNAIDWVMFKTADENNIFYCYPHIVFSECVTEKVKPDSDIQYDHSSLCETIGDRLSLEIDYWMKHKDVKGIKYDSDIKLGIPEDINSNIIYTNTLPKRDDILSNILIIRTDDYISLIEKIEKLPVQYYTINGKYLVIVPHSDINNKVLDEAVLDGGYLNIDCPV